MNITDQDRKILATLQIQGRLTNLKLAETVNMTESTCLRRVKALEETGVVTGYRAHLCPNALGFKVMAYIFVQLDQRTETDAQQFFEAVLKEKRIIEAVAVTGSPDLILKAVAKDMDDLADLTMHGILRHEGVRDISSSIVMRQLKGDEGLPV